MSDEEKTVHAQDENEQAEVEATETDEVVDTEVESDNETAETEETESVEEKEPEVEAEPVERKVFTMPVAKAQEEKKRAVEKARKEAYEAAKAEFEAGHSNADAGDMPELDEVAKKHGLDPQAARELAGAILKKAPKVDTSKYDELLKQKEVASEFEEKVVPMIRADYPGVTDAHIAKVRKQIEELAFTKGYNTYRIEDIYAVRRSDFEYKNSIGAEAPGGKGTDVAEFRILSDSDEMKLADRDPKTYERYVKWREGQESRYKG